MVRRTTRAFCTDLQQLRKQCTDPPGRVFYTNTKTGQSQYEVPGAGEFQPEVQQRCAMHAEPGTATTWQECVDPDTGSTYFYNSTTGATQWEAPDDELVSSGAMRGCGWTAAAFGDDTDAGGGGVVVPWYL